MRNRGRRQRSSGSISIFPVLGFIVMSDIAIPLCVDLDGTLTPIDTLHESILSLRARGPGTWLRLPLWLSRGKAAFKHEVGAHASMDFTRLPFRPELLEWLEAERATGRPLVLVTAADQSIADGVAEHLGLFGEVIGSGGFNNLAGGGKG